MPTWRFSSSPIATPTPARAAAASADAPKPRAKPWERNLSGNKPGGAAGAGGGGGGGGGGGETSMFPRVTDSSVSENSFSSPRSVAAAFEALESMSPATRT